MSQIGDVASAYFIDATAVHTFNTLVLHHRLPRWCCIVATVTGWVTAGLMGMSVSTKLMSETNVRVQAYFQPSS